MVFVLDLKTFSLSDLLTLIVYQKLFDIMIVKFPVCIDFLTFMMHPKSSDHFS